ncbi:chromosome transmission fidelity protein 18 homolog [Macrobrachium nipponense]|uniref:chromosome transmission fidelity protein 18 homolog n=2 Tax=Macrobrachium nipponense TaxID=159736 RepID=UPI0030C879C5
MDEYPDPDDMFEMMHQEELEAMREMEDFDIEAAETEAATIPPSIKRSLKFTSPVPSTLASKDDNSSAVGVVGTSGIDEDSVSRSQRPKRPIMDEFEDDVAQFINEDFQGNRKKRQKPLVPIVQPPVFQDPTLDLVAHEADISLIERIVEMRKSQHVNEFLETAPTSLSFTRSNHIAHIHRRLPEGDFQAITTEAGERFYLNKIDEEELNQQILSISATQKTLCLLSVPYTRLKAQAEEEQIRQGRRKAEKLQAAEDSGLESGNEDDKDNVKDSLWVEVYKPKHYLDLLSDESTNRIVLQWVKLWDKVVFGKENKPRQKEEKKTKEKIKMFAKKTGPDIIAELDDHGRPAQKAILLCGPPGLGKTTLAHIIARHAGYNPVEMNASDDRSVEVFRKNLENATSMKAVMGVDKRPNCLIIDEIDGAPAPSINWLVNMLSGKATSEPGTKKKKKDSAVLMQRPVICICNELYTPALRPLRQLALVIQFPPTHNTRLAQRLSEVCRKQHLKADLTVLLALCDKMENDIRGCMSVLQFVRSTKSDLRLNDVDGSAVGQKDYQRSLFSVWHDIFSLPRPKKKRRVNPHELQHNDGVLIPMPDLSGDLEDFGEHTTLTSRYQRILKTVESCGEYEKLTQGWFENYLTMKFKHTHMEPVSRGLEWAVFSDIVKKEIMHSQAWIMLAFLPYSCVAYHLLFATHQWPKIQFPTQVSEMNQKIAKTVSLLTSMVSEMSPATRSFADNVILVRDILPFLLQIIQPNLRPVNTQLYSKQEKEELARLINTMISYNLTYTQERSLDGQYSFTLDPNMEEIVRFPDLKPEKQLTYATRQLIAREIELEKVRRAELYFTNQKTKEAEKMKAYADEKKKSSSDPVPVVVPNHLQKLKAKPLPEGSDGKKGSGVSKVVDVAQVPKDFFGRVIDRQALQEDKSATNEIVKSDIWFRFKEGYSNAVRRPVKMKDLF